MVYWLWRSSKPKIGKNSVSGDIRTGYRPSSELDPDSALISPISTFFLAHNDWGHALASSVGSMPYMPVGLLITVYKVTESVLYAAPVM